MLGVQIDPELLERLEAYQHATGTSKKWVVAKALQEFLDKDAAIDDQAKKEIERKF
jgi:predicted transcriptional regulator